MELVGGEGGVVGEGDEAGLEVGIESEGVSLQSCVDGGFGRG